MLNEIIYTIRSYCRSLMAYMNRKSLPW